MGRRNRRTPPRSSIPAVLTPRAEWDHPDPDPDPVATQPAPPPSTALVPANPTDNSVSAEDAAAIRARIPACNHCGGRHVRACPRVKSMKFHPNGSLAGVDFWPDDKWRDDHVLWLDDIE